MKKYDSYKDSGIEWIGEIPRHWKAVPMRFLLRQRITDGPHETPTFLPEGVPFLSVDGIQEGELVFEECRKISEEDHGRYKLKCVVEKHDILMGKAASVGKVAQVKVDFEFSIWSPLALLKPDHNKITSAYFEYFLKSKYAKDNVNILSTFNTQQNISMTDIPRIYYVIPNSIEEQTAIANYLDRKTAEIDELIADKKRLLELYDEEKTSIINQAVTKGINPDAPMKDSGIEWLGEIPEHWEIPKMKYICKFILDGTHGSFSRVINGYRLLSVRNIIDDQFVFRDDDSKVSKENFLEISKRFLIQPNDIQLAIVGATLGKVAIVKDLPEPFVTQRSVATLRVNEKCTTEYLFYFLKSLSFQSFLWLNAGFSAQPGIYLGTIQNSLISLPKIDEQQAIAQHIETECARIDAKKSRTEKLIELLTEYRTALISEVVTGKIKVVD